MSSKQHERPQGPVTKATEALVVWATLALCVWVYSADLKQQAIDTTTRYAIEVAQGYAKESLVGTVAMKVLGIDAPKGDAAGGFSAWLGKYVQAKPTGPGPSPLDTALQQALAPRLGVTAEKVRLARPPAVLSSTLNADGTTTLNVQVDVDAGGAKTFQATALEAANGTVTVQAVR